MSGKFPIPLLTACFLLAGCDSEPAATGSGFDIQLPDKIRTSLAVDFSQVEGIATVNDRLYQMQRVGDQFQAVVPNIPANSSAAISLLFREMYDGQLLNLAQTEPQTFSIGSTDQPIRITDNYSYEFDDDNDGVSNIGERNDGTDPFVPENVGTRTITVEFNLPQRIEDPQITQITPLIADRNRPFSLQGAFVRASGVVPNGSTIDIDIRLFQQFQGAQILIAEALDQVDAGNLSQTVFLQDTDFDFDQDRDGDGVSNIDEMQSGGNPLIAE